MYHTRSSIGNRVNTGTAFDSLPQDARVFRLRKRSKLPATAHAHHNSLPLCDFVYLGGNYGIALDGQYLVVDIDNGDPDWLASLPPTWTQRTPGGIHRLFRTPAGFRGWNHKIKVGTNGSTRILGDIKVRGYIVGPGSEVDADRGRPAGVYVLLDARDPVAAPDWLLAMAASPPSLDEQHAAERANIALGENDDELTKIAGFLRHRGFTEGAIASMLQAIGDMSGVMEQDVTRGLYVEDDYKRIARSVGRKPIGDWQELTLALPGIRFGSETQIVGAPIRWWVHGFVPQNELVMLFGKGKVGKSSWASWLAAVVTARGGKFLFVSTEEPFERFLARAILCGANPALICTYDAPSSIKLPDKVQTFQLAVEAMGGTDVLYFDAINSHFTAVQGQNTAERARACLSPLAEWAQRSKTTIIGAFHENKAGDYLGSVEMVNVSRHVLKATRRRGQPMHVDVFLTNLFDPEMTAVFESASVPFVDPRTGEVQREEGPDGMLREAILRVCKRVSDIPRGNLETALESVIVGELAEPKKRRTSKDDTLPFTENKSAAYILEGYSRTI